MTDQVTGTAHREAPFDEGVVASGATVTPGMGVEVTGIDGMFDDAGFLLQPVSTAEKTGAQARFAREQRVPPRAEEGPVLEQAYQAGEHIEYRIYRRGDVVENALLAAGGDLETASQATVTPGDALAFYSDGSLKISGTAGAEVAIAREEVDNSGASAGSHARLSVEVL